MLRKQLNEFLPRTLLQPFLLVFVFTYVFPKIGQGVGGGTGPAAESAFATLLVAGVVGITILFQGIQSVALPMVQEFGYTKEIEDRVLAPLPVSLVALGKVTSGAIQGLIAALLVFPIAAVVPANDVHLSVQLAGACSRWCRWRASRPRRSASRSGPGSSPGPCPMMFGVIVIPLTFLGCVYYSWTALGPIKIWGFSWLKWLVLVNPLVYMSEGFRGAFTTADHMSLAVVYLALAGFAALFLYLGINGFKKRVLS